MNLKRVFGFCRRMDPAIKSQDDGVWGTSSIVRSVILTLFLFSLPLSASTQPLPQLKTNWLKKNSVILKGLDKVTARVFSARVFVNQRVRFGSLEVYVRSSFETAPEETPEKICFVEIYDTPPGKKQDMVFSGWMFASNPALSSLEHAVYDVWIE